jgi:hypothetical protein
MEANKHHRGKDLDLDLETTYIGCQFYIQANVTTMQRATSTYLHTRQEDEFLLGRSGHGSKETLLPLMEIAL